MTERKRKLTNKELDFLFKVDVLRTFVEAHGWSALTRQVRVSDIGLYRFVAHLRDQYRADRITDLAVEALEAIPGWTWTPREDRHRAALDELRRFVKQHRWDQLASLGGERGEQLSAWCGNRRQEKRRGTIQPWLVTALEAIPGWSWEPFDDRYEQWLASLREHVASHGWDSLHRDTRDASGAALGNWVHWVRYLYHRDELPDWVLLELDGIPGWSWTPIEHRQQRNLELLHDFVSRHGWDEISTATVIDGIAIGSWIHSCRSRKRRGELGDELCEQLEAIPGWTWEPRDEALRAWLRTLRTYVACHGWSHLTPSTRDETGAAIGSWVANIRQQHRQGAVPEWVQRELEQIDGWSWAPHDDRHQRKLELLRTFIACGGWDAFHWELEIDGEQIGAWVNRCRTRQHHGDLPRWLCDELAAIPGWRWR